MIIRNQDVEVLSFNGLEIFDYTSKCKEKSSFAIIVVPPNISHQLSWSKRSDKFYYVIEGKIEFTINNEDYVLAKGDFCIIKKGDKFKYKNNFKDDVKLVLVHTPNFIIEEEIFK